MQIRVYFIYCFLLEFIKELCMKWLQKLSEELFMFPSNFIFNLNGFMNNGRGKKFVNFPEEIDFFSKDMCHLFMINYLKLSL